MPVAVSVTPVMSPAVASAPRPGVNAGMNQVAATAGLITGVTETATGIGGPPLALVYQHQPVAVMRSTLAVCFLVGQVMSLIFLFAAGQVRQPQLLAAAQLLPALGVGALLSHYVHHRINERFMRSFVQLFAVASGVVLLVKAL